MTKNQYDPSATSGTIFASRKLAVRDYLMAIAILCNGAKGISALQLARDLDVQYQTAFVLAHKLREAMAVLDLAGDLGALGDQTCENMRVGQGTHPSVLC